MQETGVNWSLLPRRQQWKARVEKIFFNQKTITKFGYNTKDESGNIRQWGGTGVFTHGKLAYYSAGAGQDKKGLGRWTWASYSGKGGMNLRVVSIYQPCASKGTQTVSAVQRSAMQEENDDRDTRIAFREDFKAELATWIQAGDQIVVGGDVNESVFHHTILDMFQEAGMRNLIFDVHGSRNAPKTYYNTAEGRVVDGIWGTPGIQVHRCGYLEPGDFPGNHSLLWVDISYSSALGHNPLRPTPPSARRLQLDYPKVVKKYKTTYRKAVDKHQLRQRQFRLENSTRYGVPLTPQQCNEAEAIDNLREKCMRRAEKKCRHLKMGAVQFSEAIAIPLKKIAFWDIAIQRKFPDEYQRPGRRRRNPNNSPNKHKISARLWRRKKKAAGITMATKDMTKQDMEEQRREAKKEYLQAKKDNDSLRIKFLDQFPKKIQEKLKRKEEQRKMGRIAKLVTGKLESKSVLKLETEAGELTEKKDIEQCLLRVNKAKTHASDNTPFLQEPLLSDFGYRNTGENGDKVLAGTYQPPPGTNPYAEILLRELKRDEPPGIPSTTAYHPRKFISTEDHIRGWKRAKVNTSSGMSNLHFGMFKANAQDIYLAEIDASMRSIAYTTGYAFRRWKRGVDVQLLKRSKDYRADKLRTILLLEADFNMNNKVLGADAMKAGESRNQLAADNYGGRKWFRTAEVSLNHQLTCNSIWARRGRAVIISNDAKGCYDRIAHVVVDMALRRLGIPKPALQSMLTTIQEMEHYIRTGFGDSDDSYGQQPHELPPQGILQGNGAGPAGWFAIATVIINAMKRQGYGYKQWSLIKKRAITITCFAFVDDTDLIHANNNPDITTAQVIQEAQAALTLWEGLLHATGGALAPEKSYWYLVEIVWKNSRWTYQTIEGQPGELFLQNGTHRVKRCEVHTANEALGIQARPDSNMQDEKEYLIQRVAKWCDGVRTKRLQRHEAWYSLKATIMKTLEYPLIATTFTKGEIEEIMTPLLKIILPLCGLQKKYPHKLLYGTISQRGCGLKNLYTLQLLYHLQVILRHGHRRTPTQDLLIENFDLVQWYVGSEVNFWELPFQIYGFLAPTGWTKATWKQLSETNLVIKGPNLAVPKLREKDAYLIDAFIDLNLPHAQIETLNNCRMYLGVTRLSEICTVCGSRIDEYAWQGKRSPHIQQPQCFKTHKPTANDWDLWRHTLRQCFLIQYAASTALRDPIGSWFPDDMTAPTWLWWRDTSNTVYEFLPRTSSWRQWTSSHVTNAQLHYHQPTPVSGDIPVNVVRITIHKARTHNAIIVIRTSPATIPTPITPTPTTVVQAIAQLPRTQNWSVKSLDLPDNGVTIAQQIQLGTALAVCDGSLKDHLGTSAIIVDSPHAAGMARAVNMVPGPIEEGDSHRCELAGLYGTITLIHSICKIHEITHGSIRIACDNIHALNVFEDGYTPDVKNRNFDLCSAIHSLLQQSPITWKNEHVKGHQDNKKAVANLTRPEQLNVYVDQLAKTYWQHIVQSCPDDTFPQPKHIEILGEEWQIWNGNDKFVHPTINRLYEAIHNPITKLWWIRHKVVKPEDSQNIDYEILEKTMPTLQQPLQQWCSKSASANCGVGTTLVHWKYQSDAKCPRCGYDKEDTTHVSQCHGAGADDVFEKSMKTISQFFDDSKTCPDIQLALQRSLHSWRHAQPLLLTNMSDAICQTIQEQTQIGWQSLLEGLLSKKWRKMQHAFYNSHNIKKSSRKWAQDLTKLLIRCGHKQWQHRYNYKHYTGRPRHKAYERLLNRCILRELMRGTQHLLPGDKYKAQYSIVPLLKRTLAFRKQWLINIRSARQRFLRIQQQNDALKLRSKETSFIYNWMKTNQTR